MQNGELVCYRCAYIGSAIRLTKKNGAPKRAVRIVGAEIWRDEPKPIPLTPFSFRGYRQYTGMPWSREIYPQNSNLGVLNADRRKGQGPTAHP
jgi:hypothetical protein